MSTPGKVARTSRLSAPNATAGAVGPAPGKRALTDSLSAPKLAAPEPDGVAEVDDALDSAACVDGQNASGDCSMSAEKRGLLIGWIASRAESAADHWHTAISAYRAQAILENASTVPLWVKLLAEVTVSVLPGAVAKGGELLVAMAPKAANAFAEVAKSKELVAAVLGLMGPITDRALDAATANADANPKAALLSALRAVPGQWVDQLRKDALAMDDGGRSLLCAALDPDVLTPDKFDAAVADAVKRFTAQVTAIGPDRRGGVHAAYMMNTQGQMRLAVVSFDQMRSERLHNNERQSAGDNRYTFQRWIDDDMAAAALTAQVLNTAPPVLHIDDHGGKLANPDAPELDKWRSESAPQFQPQYVDASPVAAAP